MPTWLQASGPGSFPPGHPEFGLLNLHSPQELGVVVCLAIYKGKSPRFLVNRSGKSSFMLVCQLILWSMALSLSARLVGRECFSSRPTLPGTPQY